MHIIEQTKTGVRVRIVGEFKRRWWREPICWFRGHHRKYTIRPYGVRVRQCRECGRTFWKRTMPHEKNPLYSGEFGTMQKVTFVTTTRGRVI